MVYCMPASARLHAIDLRAQLLSADPLVELQLDPYLFLREAYRQRRHCMPSMMIEAQKRSVLL